MDQLENNLDWDKYYMSMCMLVAMKSKDTSTKIGAIIVGKDNEIKSTGYNSFVRGMNDKIQSRFKRPKKYFYFEHAERNAIYNATLNGICLKGCRIYTNAMPCADCARGIIQSGIDEVIISKDWSDFENSGKWDESTKATMIMFEETGKVKVRIYNGSYIKELYFFKRGEKI